MLFLYIALPTIVVLLGVWLFLIAPGKNSKMDYYKTKKYAHRGLHGTVGSDTFCAENSLTAFSRAVERGFGIELDVRLSKDGELVVFHDATLDRVTNGSGKVSDLTLQQLKQLSLMGTEDKIPTFTEVLELVGGKVPLLVEIKEQGMDHSISEKTAEMLSGYGGEFIVESFSPLAFGAIKQSMPGVPCGFLADKLTENEKYRSFKYRIIQRFLLNFIARPAFIAMNYERPSMFPLPILRTLFRVPVVAWTVRSKEAEEEAYKNGFCTVIFENYLPDSADN